MTCGPELNLVTAYPFNVIGDGSVVAAGCVVTMSVQPYAGGDPIKLIRPRFEEGLTAYLLKLKWWDWPVEKISDNLGVLRITDLGLIPKVWRGSFRHIAGTCCSNNISGEGGIREQS